MTILVTLDRIMLSFIHNIVGLFLLLVYASYYIVLGLLLPLYLAELLGKYLNMELLHTSEFLSFIVALAIVYLPFIYAIIRIPRLEKLLMSYVSNRILDVVTDFSQQIKAIKSTLSTHGVDQQLKSQ